MAKGRFISKEICLDKRVNQLSDGFSMVGFTWLITHADCEGRTYGDPAIVKSLIFPRRPDITIEMVEEYIWEWQSLGLINLYESDGDVYIEFPNFEKHQTGLRKDREAISTIPTNSGITPAYSGKNRVKLSKVNVKLSEVKVGAEKTAHPEPHYELCGDDGLEIPQKPIKAKKRPQSDARSKTPAITAFRRLTGRYPNSVNYQDVIDILGEKPDEVKLAACYKEWCARGYNSNSIKWLTEWYKNGIPQRGGNKSEKAKALEWLEKENQEE